MKNRQKSEEISDSARGRFAPNFHFIETPSTQSPGFLSEVLSFKQTSVSPRIFFAVAI